MKLARYMMMSLLILTARVNALTFEELEQEIDSDINTYLKPMMVARVDSPLLKGFAGILWRKLNGRLYTNKNFIDYLKDDCGSGVERNLLFMLEVYDFRLTEIVKKACFNEDTFFFDEEIFAREYASHGKKSWKNDDTVACFIACEAMSAAFENLCHEIFLIKLAKLDVRAAKPGWVDYEIQPLPLKENKGGVVVSEKEFKALVKKRCCYAYERLKNKDYCNDIDMTEAEIDKILKEGLEDIESIEDKN